MLKSVLKSCGSADLRIRKLLKDMVGTWGLEPQTSTVSNQR